MNLLILFFLILHILVWIACLVLTQLKVLKSPSIDMVFLAFIPVFGLGTLLLRSHVYRKKERKTRTLELARLQLDDDAQRSISVEDAGATDEVVPLSEAFLMNDYSTRRSMMKDALYVLNTSINLEEDELQEKVVPLQEALQLNDSHTKRELIMDILYTDATGFIPQLSEARENDDSEVVHYAITALVEIQKEFDLQFQAISKELAAHPDDERVIRKYQGFLEQYLSSGLLEGSRRDAQLLKYVQVLEKRLEKNGGSLSLWIKKADADMLLKHTEALLADARQMIAIRPENEQGYLYLLKYYALQRDPQGIGQVLAMVEHRKIYLSPTARAELEFWK